MTARAPLTPAGGASPDGGPARHAADLAWPQVPGATLAVVPLGSMEQHGPHLPLDTDTVIARAVCDRLAHRLSAQEFDSEDKSAPSVLVLPPVPYGASGEHESFPGTVSIGQKALRAVLVELVRSLTNWADRVLLISGHGGNEPGLRSAVTLLRAEGRNLEWAMCGLPGWDAHAGWAETSIMLALEPHRVQMHFAEVGNTTAVQDLYPTLRTGGVAAASANGVLGDPRGATAEEGGRLLADLVDNLAQRLGPSAPMRPYAGATV